MVNMPLRYRAGTVVVKLDQVLGGAAKSTPVLTTFKALGAKMVKATDKKVECEYGMTSTAKMV